MKNKGFLLLAGKKGFTLIEVVIFILLLGIALVPLIGVLGNALHSSAGHHAIRTATYLAQGLMEEVSGKNFEDIESFTLEGSGLSTIHPGFAAEVDVRYVLPDDFNTPVESPTDFKRIRIKINLGNNSADITAVSPRIEPN